MLRSGHVSFSFNFSTCRCLFLIDFKRDVTRTKVIYTILTDKKKREKKGSLGRRGDTTRCCSIQIYGRIRSSSSSPLLKMKRRRKGKKTIVK